MKSGATAEAAGEIAEHGREGALVISFQNGISNVDVLASELGDRFEIVRGMVPYNVAYLGEGRFHKGVAGDSMPRTRRNARARRSVGNGPAALKLSDDMLGIAWGKLLINLNNAVNALSGRTLIEELKHRDYRRVFAAAMREGLRLLRRAGIEPAKVGEVRPRLLPRVIDSPDWLFNHVFLNGRSTPRRARRWPTISPRAARPRSIISTASWSAGRADRRDAPVNRAIVELIRKAEAGAKPYRRQRFAAKCSAASEGSPRSAGRVARRGARSPDSWSRNKALRSPRRTRPR